MSVEEKQITIAQNVPKVFNAGYEKGKAENGTAKEEQEKTVTITENGTTEVLPDEGKVLSKVTVDVDVADSYYDIFWDNYQDFGNHPGDSYRKSWNDLNFKPKYDIRLSGHSGNFFADSRITNLLQILKDCNRVLDTSKATNLEAFIYSSKITHLPCISFEGITGGTGSAFYGDSNLVYIDKIILKKGLKWSTTMFNGSTSLTTIAEIEGEFEVNVNIAPCSKLDDLTIDNIINAYADMTGQTAPILTVHPTVKAKIEANETWLNTLINKNVTLA